jgi:hypothetical protein
VLDSGRVLFYQFLILLFMKISKIKSFVFGLAFLGAPILISADLHAQGEAPCEEEIAEDGELITVTVCGRKTTWAGAMVGAHCTKESTTSCTFTNM